MPETIRTWRTDGVEYFSPVEPETYTWGESVGTIDIPLNDHTGNWAATLLLDRDAARALWDMLGDAIKQTGDADA